MKRIFTKGGRVTALLSLSLLSALTMRADSYQWTGGGASGDWTDPANFYDVTTSSTAVTAPGSADDVEVGMDALADGTSIDVNNLTVDLGFTLNITDGSFVTIETSVVNHGTTDVNSGSFVYLPAGTITNSGSMLFANATFESDGTGAASLMTNSGTVDIDVTSQFTISGYLNNTGRFTNSDASSPSDANSFGSLSIASGTSVTVTGNGYIDNLYTNFSGSASLTIGSSVSDTIHIRNLLFLQNGAFHTSNKLVLSPVPTSSTSSLSGTGMIGQIGGSGGPAAASLTGGVTVSQYIPGGRRAYRFYSHPFTTAMSLSQIENSIDITGNSGAANGFTPTTSNNPSAMWFNTVTGDDATAGTSTPDPGWTFFGNTTSTTGANSFKRYEGINVLVRGAKGQGLTGGTYTPSPAVITMYGSAVNTDTQTITLNTGLHNSYNLVGNPYPCVIDLASALNRSAASMSSNTFFLWDANMGMQGSFVSYDYTAGIYYVQPNTAFQVEAAFNGAHIGFSESDKFSNLATDYELFRTRNRAQVSNYITLKVYDAAYHPYDIFHLQLNSDATNGKERLDAGKPENMDLNFYSFASTGEALAVDARPYVAGDVIPMGINATTPQTFIIRADDFYAPAGTVLYLHDKYMGVYKELSQGEEYSFAITTDPASQGNNRFELRMGDVSNTETVKAATGLSVSITPNPATAEINIAYNAQAAGNTTIHISNMLGQQVYTADLGAQQTGNVSVPVQNLPAGVYIVNVACGSKTTTQRFVKQ